MDKYIDVETDEMKDKRVESNLRAAYYSPKVERSKDQDTPADLNRRREASQDVSPHRQMAAQREEETDGGASEMNRIKLHHKEKEKELVRHCSSMFNISLYLASTHSLFT